MLNDVEFFTEDRFYNMHYKNKDSKEPALSGKALADYYLSLVEMYPSKKPPIIHKH